MRRLLLCALITTHRSEFVANSLTIYIYCSLRCFCSTIIKNNHNQFCYDHLSSMFNQSQFSPLFFLSVVHILGSNCQGMDVAMFMLESHGIQPITIYLRHCGPIVNAWTLPCSLWRLIPLDTSFFVVFSRSAIYSSLITNNHSFTTGHIVTILHSKQHKNVVYLSQPHHLPTRFLHNRDFSSYKRPILRDLVNAVSSSAMYSLGGIRLTQDSHLSSHNYCRGRRY